MNDFVPAPDDFSVPGLRPERSELPVLIAGSVTTGLALAGQLALQSTGTNVMGWYANYVLPVGALLVGLVASSGFGLASWLTGTKISGRLLGLTLLVLSCGYAGAMWFEYRHALPGGAAGDGTPISFLAWFDYMSRSFAFEGKNGKAGEPLGMLGYGLRVLEVIGFVGGGALIPFGLKGLPYCEACNLYMRKKNLAVVAEDLAPKLFGDKSPERLEQRARLADESRNAIEAILAASEKDAGALLEAVAQHGPLARKGEADKALSRVWFELVRCRACNRGRLEVTRVRGQGKQTSRTKLAPRELQPGVVEGLAQG